MYRMCELFHCLPSQLEDEDIETLARLARVDFIIQSKLKADAERTK